MSVAHSYPIRSGTVGIKPIFSRSNGNLSGQGFHALEENDVLMHQCPGGDNGTQITLYILLACEQWPTADQRGIHKNTEVDKILGS